MSAIGLPTGLPAQRIAPTIIGAHWDHRRSDLVFARTQSLEVRAAPWDRRLRPLKSWSELGGYASVAVAVMVTAAFLV